MKDDLNYCWKCGAELKKDDRFCPRCGADVREMEKYQRDSVEMEI